jgi:MATE family multidrug resistance protein
MMITMLQEMVNLIFLGHLNKADILAGVGIGNMFVNICGLSIVFGFNGALETLVSQAYGAGNLDLCGVYLNRGRFVLLCAFVPVVIMLFQCESILTKIGQDASVSKYAQMYVVAYFPGLILNGLNDSQRRFLNMTGWTRGPLVIQIIGVVCHIIACWYFVWVKDLAIAGVGYASSTTNFIIYMSLLGYTASIPEIREAVQMPTMDTFRGIGEYLGLGIPSAAMLCLEWWAFEIMTLITGYIGVTEQAAQIILLNIVGTTFMIALGLQAAASATVGQQIGNGNVPKAKEYFKVNMTSSFLIIFCAVSTVLIFSRQVLGIFTGNMEVIDMCESVIFMVACGTFPDLW